MSNLVVDQGNTRTKLAIFNANKIVEIVTSENKLVINSAEQMIEKYHPLKVIYSTVTSDNRFFPYVKSIFSDAMELNELTSTPFTNSYATQSTLGKDRLAAIAGAYNLKPNCNCLVIDAGTAITYDFINSDGYYLGGSIAPGLQMRFKALHTFTSKLPHIEADPNLPVIGNDTTSSINSGVFHGMIHEIDGFISHYKKYYPDLFVFLTGGDALIFEKSIKNSIFVALNLVLSGLNSILEYNNAE